MNLLLKEDYEKYKKRTNTNISESIFSNPKAFIKFHERYIGTVLEKYDKDLQIYEHIIYFDHMLFFSHLTQDELENGPINYMTLDGKICLL